mgnify:CR=1 FL=1
MEIMCVLMPLIGAAVIIWSMIAESFPRQRSASCPRYGISRRELSRITAGVMRRDRRRGRHGWQA